MSDSFWPHGLQHARPLCPLPTPGVYSESAIPFSHLILCCPLLLLPLIFPSIRVFTRESVLRIRWPEYWSFSFSISPSNIHLLSGIILPTPPSTCSVVLASLLLRHPLCVSPPLRRYAQVTRTCGLSFNEQLLLEPHLPRWVPPAFSIWPAFLSFQCCPWVPCCLWISFLPRWAGGMRVLRDLLICFPENKHIGPLPFSELHVRSQCETDKGKTKQNQSSGSS